MNGSKPIDSHRS